MLKFGICDNQERYSILFKKCFTDEFIKEYEKQWGVSEEIEWDMYLSGEEVIENYNNDTDIIFMDTEVGLESGFDITRKIYHSHKDVAVVYMSKSDNCMNEAFVCRPLGFIRKSRYMDDIRIALCEIIEYIGEKKKRITVRTNGCEMDVVLNEVYAVKVCNHKLTFLLKNNSLSMKGNLSTYEEELIKSDFIRINRETIINMKYIKKIEGKIVYLYGGYNFEISRSKVNDVLNQWMRNI